MLLRREAQGEIKEVDGVEALKTIAISQPSHAWLSGQLARHWGNALFVRPKPFDEFCLATEQHDIGWHEWERAPVLNAATGLPLQFFEMAGAIHTDLWREGVNRARNFGRFVGVLVSLHAVTIFGFAFDPAKATPDHAAKVQSFLAALKSQRAEWLESLRTNPAYAPYVSETLLDDNRRLIALFDRLSLDICFGITTEKTYPDIPVAPGKRTALHLYPVNGDKGVLALSPWPFAAEEIRVRILGRLLEGRFTTQADLDAALMEAPDCAIETILRAG
ncbi:DUF3891 family protein [Beijerinckia mobilis]|uniref:DUF3891 family protein n=1 Tax=Beijerinckia mobilis TaxID=231434 RepID=UPI00068C9A9E|nr:DUF3891 family protein [Beijerinckia mobilis]